jgi:hypothetical protein
MRFARLSMLVYGVSVVCSNASWAGYSQRDQKSRYGAGA